MNGPKKQVATISLAFAFSLMKSFGNQSDRDGTRVAIGRIFVLGTIKLTRSLRHASGRITYSDFEWFNCAATRMKLKQSLIVVSKMFISVSACIT